jgi:hypothetical protein
LLAHAIPAQARITIENRDDKSMTLFYQVDYLLAPVPKDAAYFHAQFRRVNPLPYKQVYTIVDGIEGWERRIELAGATDPLRMVAPITAQVAAAAAECLHHALRRETIGAKPGRRIGKVDRTAADYKPGDAQRSEGNTCNRVSSGRRFNHALSGS